jgi:hypothetical protein
MAKTFSVFQDLNHYYLQKIHYIPASILLCYNILTDLDNWLYVTNMSHKDTQMR